MNKTEMLLEKIIIARDKLLEKGINPVCIFIHPTKATDMGDVRSIADMEVIVPNWHDLGWIALWFGVDEKSRDFWNPDNCYFLDQEAMDNIKCHFLKNPEAS